jgi:hypothetical protein
MSQNNIIFFVELASPTYHIVYYLQFYVHLGLESPLQFYIRLGPKNPLSER